MSFILIAVAQRRVLPWHIQTRTAKTLFRKFETNTLFPEMKLRGLVPHSYIHVYVSDLYIPRIGLPWEYINCSQIHECENWERGRAVSFLVNINRILFAVHGC
jgi:hypothetical protein